MKKYCALLLAAVTLILTLMSCSPAGSDGGNFNAGYPVSPDELRRYGEELSDGVQTSVQLPAEPPKGKIVYWTAGGTVYHLYRDCGHISSAKEVETGTVGMAKNAGIGKFCRTCAKKYAEESSEN